MDLHVQGTSSLLASCESMLLQKHLATEDKWEKLGEAEGAHGDRCEWWPLAAKHRPGDFRGRFSINRSCLLRYRFSSHPHARIPASDDPMFEDDDY